MISKLRSIQLTGLSLFSKLVMVFIALVVFFSLLRQFSPVYFQYSMTNSIHKGIWLMRDCSLPEVSIGSYVSFKIDRPDFYPSKLWPNVPMLLKEVIGLPGDSLNASGLDIEICAQDSGQCRNIVRIQDVPFQTLPAKIPAGTFFAAGEHRLSVDSRYFSVVELDKIEGCGVPLFR